MIARGNLKQYVDSQRPDIFEDEVKDVNHLRQCDMLIGVGLRGVYWDIVTARRLSLLSMLSSKPKSLTSVEPLATTE